MGSLFNELKRRNVFRVGVAYAVVGWVLAQVAGTLEQALNLPPWFDTAIVAALIIGLPIALLLAWAFEMTPEGVKKTADVDADKSITPTTGKSLNRLILASLVLALGYFIWESRFSGPPDDAVEVAGVITNKTVAVLPFASFSEDAEQGWFADGLTEEILNALARTRDLLVSSRTSSFAYKATTKDVRTIAAELGVAHVLEGSVRRGGDRIRITAQLIRASDGFHLWSETYDRDFADVIDIQEDVAINIANALQTAMDPEALAAMVDAGTSSVEAYEAYVEGTAILEDIAGDIETITGRALAKFEEAVAIDPAFARAHGRLADIWYGTLIITNIGSDSALSTAERLANGNRHNALAIVVFGEGIEADMRRGVRAETDLRYREAMAIYAGVLAIDPGHENAYGNLIRLKYISGDRAGAIAMNERLHEISTNDLIFWNTVIINYVWSLAPELAAASADHALSEYPSNSFVSYQAQRAYLMNGEIEKAAQMMRLNSTSLEPPTAKMMVRIRQACAIGDLETAEALYPEMIALSSDNDEATRWLAAKTLGYEEVAASVLRPLDVPGRLIELSSFLSYYHFDLDLYPNLKVVLDAQGIRRPKAVPVLFGCHQWREAE